MKKFEIPQTRVIPMSVIETNMDGKINTSNSSDPAEQPDGDHAPIRVNGVLGQVADQK